MLDKALREAGFSKTPLASGEDIKDFNFVWVAKRTSAQDELKALFPRSSRHGAQYIEVSIPAYIAAQYLGDAASASR